MRNEAVCGKLPAMIDVILTWTERDRRRVERRKSAVAAARVELLNHAREHGGRYVLFGSVARGEDRPDSDVDVMVDFPGREAAAGNDAEIICARNGLKPDVWLKRYVGDELMARIRREGVVLE